MTAPLVCWFCWAERKHENRVKKEKNEDLFGEVFIFAKVISGLIFNFENSLVWNFLPFLPAIIIQNHFTTETPMIK